MSFSRFDHECMAEALRLAARGLRTCHPNPRVGCVIARSGRTVGRGWHQFAGEHHAEIRALADAGEAARGGTVYVTLEPCSHEGRTGPCTESLIEAGVREVVAAATDPNPAINGRGFDRLRAAGVAVRTGLMAEAAQELNAGFYSRQQRGRPWVRIKIAQSLDGRTALANGESQWITSSASRRDVQFWRARSGALMTGIGTLLSDDPSLNVRLEGAGPQPLRVVVDSHWRTPAGARTLGKAGQVLVAGCEDRKPPPELARSPAELLPLPALQGRVDLHALLQELGRREINEVQVEAGATLCGALLSARLVDELLVYLAPSVMGERARGAFGIGSLESMSDRVSFNWVDTVRVGQDMRLRLIPGFGEE